MSEQETRYRMSEWSDLRNKLVAMLSSHSFQSIVGFVVILNVVVIWLETDRSAECINSDCEIRAVDKFIAAANITFLAFYTLEAVIRIFTYRLKVFKDLWNRLDFVIVVFGYIDTCISQFYPDGKIPGFQMLRVFRVARLLRSVRILRLFPELHAMMRGFVSAFAAMFWGYITILLFLLIWSILIVELVHPENLKILDTDDLCYDSFGSVSSSMLFLFQTLVAGDNWGQCTIPVINAASWTFLIFSGALVCVQLGFSNLVLAVIVEKATEARERDREHHLLDKEKQRRDAGKRVHDICQAIDADQDGLITIDELVSGFENHDQFRAALTMLDIDVQDLHNLFSLMDKNHSGGLSYEEMTDCIHKADTQDIRRQIMFVKLQMQDVVRVLQSEIEAAVDNIAQMTRDALSQLRVPAELAASQPMVATSSRNTPFPGTSLGRCDLSPPAIADTAAADLEHEMTQVWRKMNADFASLLKLVVGHDLEKKEQVDQLSSISSHADHGLTSNKRSVREANWGHPQDQWGVPQNHQDAIGDIEIGSGEIASKRIEGEHHLRPRARSSSSQSVPKTG